MFAGKKSAQIREILISESAWEEMTCLFAPSLEVSLTYIIERIELEGQNGIAFYTVTSGADTEGARNYIPFTYSGSGDPELEAEFALRCFLDGN